LWWVAHQIIHLHDPWSTTYLAAPVGLQLGYHTLTPLLGVVMAPVTLAFGPSASYNLLNILLPGLACYAMYRAARLWLPTRAGAIAAGACFGLSAMLSYQVWYHLNICYGAALLPVTLEAAVRLRRNPTVGQAAILGVVLGASVLVNPETAVMALILAALALIPWLATSRAATTLPNRLKATAAAGVVAIVVASPQLLAMYSEARAGTTVTPSTLVGLPRGGPAGAARPGGCRPAGRGGRGLAVARQALAADRGRGAARRAGGGLVGQPGRRVGHAHHAGRPR
jgi:hypothetical protein